MASEKDGIELLQGTLDLIVLRALSTMGPQHAYGLAARLAQVSDHPLSLNQGTLYPALVRLEHKGWIQGAAQAMTVLASALGPLLLAACIEWTGSYAAMFNILAAIIGALAFVSVITPLPRAASVTTSA